MIPARGKVLVRPIETPETLPGGQVVLTAATQQELTAQQAEVMAVGELAYCADFENCFRPHILRENPYLSSADTVTADIFHACEVSPRAWVLLAPRCLVETDEPNLYVCAQDDVLAVLEA